MPTPLLGSTSSMLFNPFFGMSGLRPFFEQIAQALTNAMLPIATAAQSVVGGEHF